MIRRSYFSYLKKVYDDKGVLEILKYPYRYIGTYLGYKTSSSITGPIQGTLCLTYNCNLKCEMCDLPIRHVDHKKEGRETLSLESWKKIIQSYSKIGTSGMAISGGEPFLHKDLFEIIREIKSNGMVAQITTNGWFVTESNVEEFVKTGIDTVTISIDGLESVHDSIRGIPGSFEKATKAVDILVKARERLKLNYKINISTVFGKSNYKDIFNLIEKTKELGADCIGFIPVHTIAPNVDGALSILDEIQEREIFEVIDRLIEHGKENHFIETSEKYFNLFKSFFSGKPLPMSCLAGYTTLLTDCYGDLFPCFSFYEMGSSWGNISDYGSLEEFWQGYKIKTLRSDIKGCKDCYWNCQVETNLLYKLF